MLRRTSHIEYLILDGEASWIKQFQCGGKLAYLRFSRMRGCTARVTGCGFVLQFCFWASCWGLLTYYVTGVTASHCHNRLRCVPDRLRTEAGILPLNMPLTGAMALKLGPLMFTTALSHFLKRNKEHETRLKARDEILFDEGATSSPTRHLMCLRVSLTA